LTITKTFILVLCVLCIFSFCTTNGEKKTSAVPTSPAAANLEAPSLELHIKGNKIFNEKDQEVRLVGVNICSLEWNSKGDNVIRSAYEVFSNWNCNLVRLPLSQDYWFGTVSNWSTPHPPDNGTQYRKTVDEIIELALSFGKYIELDLHWSNAGVWGQNIGQHCMPDENSLLFWIDAATRYANNPAVLFNLYNEPYDITWEVWKNGGTVTEVKDKGKPEEKTFVYTAVGHQQLVNAIRETGANNIIIAGGVDWAYDLRGIAGSYALTDTPSGNGIMYESHIYPWKEWNGKNHDSRVLCISKDYPIMIGEIGIDPDGQWGAVSRPTWLRDMLDWIDINELHWAGWCFHKDATPNMISDWNFTPTRHHGAIMKERLLSYFNTNAHLNEMPKKP